MARRLLDASMHLPAVSEGNLDIRLERKPREPIGFGFLGSLALHAAVALLILFLLPRLLTTPPEPDQLVPIDLVMLGARTAAPPAEQQAALPQEQAKETAEHEVTDPVPQPETPPPPQALAPKARESTAPVPLAAINPENPARLPKPGAPAAAKPRPAPAPADDLATKLQSLAKLRQPAPPIAPNPRPQEGAGVSNVTASSANAAPGSEASYSAKDFLRAQVERHWYWDRRRLRAGDWAVSIHVLLNRDGSVAKAEIVDDPRHGADPDYHDLALSARNAVLLSSPLNLPPGRYESVKDITLTLDPRTASQ
jgi:outer membrane biosynthesis protein TonB